MELGIRIVDRVAQPHLTVPDISFEPKCLNSQNQHNAPTTREVSIVRSSNVFLIR